MSEKSLHDYAGATRRAPGAEFTAKIFAQIGLDRYVTASSFLGEMYVAWNRAGVTAVRRAEGPLAFEAWYATTFGRPAVPAREDDAVSFAARAKLGGEDIPVQLDLSASTPFERTVLEHAATIEVAHARPYAWLAREIEMPLSANAVEEALNRNPVPLLIPCHRVVRNNTDVGSYVFGSDAKRRMLEGEGLDLAAVENLLRRGFTYVAIEKDGEFCLPTCGDIATLVDQPGYHGLHDLDEARAESLVPCRSCRPVAA